MTPASPDPSAGRRCHRFSLWLKIPYTLFVIAFIPIWWVRHGPAHFLWFSDLALLAGLVALWQGRPLLPSILAVAVALPELAWNAVFFVRLLTGAELFGMLDYMFDSQIPHLIRAMSFIFHFGLPLILLWMVWRMGYDRRALPIAIAAVWALLLATWLLTDPQPNINLIHRPVGAPEAWLPPAIHRFWPWMVMALYPPLICLPSHWILSRLFPRPERRRG